MSNADPTAGRVDKSAAFSVTPASLTCEYRIDPLGMDAQRPRLGWTLNANAAAARGLAAAAYRILVASSPEKLAAGDADLWDSGRIASGRSQHIEYEGVPLASGQTAWWSVRTWDAVGGASEWAEPACWTAGVLSERDWHGARWIAAPGVTQPADRTAGRGPKDEYETLLLRRAFDVSKPVTRALIHVCGLGQYRLSLNGHRIGDVALAPGWTDYKKTCLYDTYDVTASVRWGENVVGLFLGNGFFNIHGGRYTKVQGTFGPVQAIGLIRFDYADGSTDYVGTDARWQAASGPITFSSVYGGEDYDARLVQAGWDAPDFDAAAWVAPAELPGPGGALKGSFAAAPPVRVVQTLPPVGSRNLAPGVTVYDLGQNAAVMLAIDVSGPAGSTVKITASELVTDAGDIDDRMCGGQSYWTYTLRGDTRESYDSHFYYQGGRYLRVDLAPAAPDAALPVLNRLEGRVIRADAAAVGQIETSNPRVNRIYSLVRWAQMSNMMSVMTDCPHREKLGWLEETHLNGPALRYNFDWSTLASKITADMFDAQRANGLVPAVVPYYPDWPESKFVWPIEWGSACVLLPWQQYLFNGDTRLLTEHYDGMKRYLQYLAEKAQGHVIDFGLGDWYDNLGQGEPTLTPISLTSTAFYFHVHDTIARIATLLGKPDEAAEFLLTAQDIRRVFNDKFFDAASGNYANGAQGSNCLPLAMGIVEPAHRDAVLANLVADLRTDGTTTGEVSFRYLLRALADAGRSDLIYETYDTDASGYGLQIKLGKTTLTEAWNGGTSSQNHFMFGQINEWLFHDLAGIQPDLAGPGFTKITIRPAFVGDLAWVKATYHSPLGPILSHWARDDRGHSLNISIPIGSRATVHLPANDLARVNEGVTPASSATGVTFLRRENGQAVFEVGSGRYAFSVATGP